MKKNPREGKTLYSALLHAVENGAKITMEKGNSDFWHEEINVTTQMDDVAVHTFLSTYSDEESWADTIRDSVSHLKESRIVRKNSFDDMTLKEIKAILIDIQEKIK